MNNKKHIQPYELVGEFVSIFPRNDRWYAHYRHDGKPIRQSLKTNSKKEARRRALAIERDLVAGEVRRPTRAPSIAAVIGEYISHLRALRRSPKTIAKYLFCFGLMEELAAKRGITRIDQVDLAFIDAFKLERIKHRAQPRKRYNHAASESKNNSQ
jgi:hypothetical protein